MAETFLSLLNVSVTAAWVVLAVLVLRLCLKKAPKWITCLLWGVVGLRLMLPISFQSPLSLIPSTQTIPQNIAVSRDPAIHTGIPAVDLAVNPVIEELFAPEGLTSINPLQLIVPVLAMVWLTGVAIMFLYAIFSSVKLYRSVRSAVHFRDNIYICDTIQTPFILGIVQPRIFLPSGLDPEQVQAVLAHEQAHLKRKDHWWKPLAHGLLMVYWYNPVLWIACMLLYRDVELACDEMVIKTMDNKAKRAYSQALVDCSFNHRTILTCPLAFGEIGIKTRIKAILHYKKPTVWFIAAAAVAAAVLAICFLTDPMPCEHLYQSETSRQSTCAETGTATLRCDNCFHSYTKEIPLKEHAFIQTRILTEPNCLRPGSAELFCVNCGKQATRDLLPTAHVLGAFTVIKEPEPGADGEQSAMCSKCGREIVYPLQWEANQDG